jgi:hypothetical protein
VRFDCIAKFKKQPFAQAHYASAAAKTAHFAAARTLFKVNAGQLPKDNRRLPKIVRVGAAALTSSVVTTDFFGFDTSDNHYKLQGLGDVSEMGDAVLGLVAQQMGKSAPRWLAIRNVSDPQIKAEGTLRQQAQVAAQIYKGFGRWSSVCSAITCWASIAAEENRPGRSRACAGVDLSVERRRAARSPLSDSPPRGGRGHRDRHHRRRDRGRHRGRRRRRSHWCCCRRSQRPPW